MKNTVLGAVLVACAAALAFAVQTETWVVASRGELAAGEMQNVVLDAGGEVVLGYAHEKFKTDETSLWCGLAGDDGTVWFGTGSGRILKLADGKLQTAFESGEMLVTSLVRTRAGDLYAATIPNGKIFRVNAAGKGELFCNLPTKHVWQLVADAQDNLYAATGPGGKVYRIDAQGRFTVALDTKRENALALALAADGTLYVGTAGPGLIYTLAPDGKPGVVADLGDTEVKALIADEGTLWAAVNSGMKAAPADFLKALSDANAKVRSPEEIAKLHEEAAAPEAAPPAATPAVVVQSALLRFRKGGASEEVRAFANSYITSLARDRSGDVLAATNNSGRVFRVAADRKFSVPLDLPETQVLTLVTREGDLVAAATGNPGAAYAISRAHAAQGTYTSDVLDARFHSTWGNLTWQGKGKLQVATRSGNVAKPDETWSEWSAATDATTAAVASPPARYLQFRCAWGEADARLASMHVAYRAENQRPRVLELQVLEQADPAALEGAQPPQPAPGKPLPPEIKRLSARKLKWKGQDPDEDVLVYWLYYRAESGKRWIALNANDPIKGLEANWNTDAIPDGWYALKVVASDEQANPRDQAQQGELVSARFLIDNGKPALADVQITPEKKVTGKATDSFGPISRIDYKLASAGTWTRVDCADGVFDEATEEFSFDLKDVPAGGDVLIVRATDAAGNWGVTAIDLPGQ